MSDKIISLKENDIEISESNYNQFDKIKIIRSFLRNYFDFILDKFSNFIENKKVDAIEFEIDDNYSMTFIKSIDNNNILITFYLKEYNSEGERQILIEKIYSAPKDINKSILIKEILEDIVKTQN